MREPPPSKAFLAGVATRRRSQWCTPSLGRCGYGHGEALALLLASGGGVNSVDAAGMTPIGFAANKNQQHLVPNSGIPPLPPTIQAAPRAS